MSTLNTPPPAMICTVAQIWAAPPAVMLAKRKAFLAAGCEHNAVDGGSGFGSDRERERERERERDRERERETEREGGREKKETTCMRLCVYMSTRTKAET